MSKCVCVCARVHTHGQVGDEEVGDSAQRLEAVDDIDDQRVADDTKHDNGAVGQDQHHLLLMETTRSGGGA